jgi:hypothetical protein
LYRVFIYRNTYNLGDAIQTVALCRLLGRPCMGVYRDEPLPAEGANLPLVANGWLGYKPPAVHSPAIFAGAHVGRHEHAFIAWMKDTGCTIGARDPYTQGLLERCGVAASMIGCATLTFERYRGVRSGRYSVDGGCQKGAIGLSNSIGLLSWEEQWNRAVGHLDLLRRAELVYTTRLHIALPCLAFGTPVIFPLHKLTRIEAKERLTLLNVLPFQYDDPAEADISDFAARYIGFLENAVGPLAPCSSPKMPFPLTS